MKCSHLFAMFLVAVAITVTSCDSMEMDDRKRNSRGWYSHESWDYLAEEQNHWASSAPTYSDSGIGKPLQLKIIGGETYFTVLAPEIIREDKSCVAMLTFPEREGDMGHYFDDPTIFNRGDYSNYHGIRFKIGNATVRGMAETRIRKPNFSAKLYEPGCDVFSQIDWSQRADGDEFERAEEVLGKRLAVATKQEETIELIVWTREHGNLRYTFNMQGSAKAARKACPHLF